MIIEFMEKDQNHIEAQIDINDSFIEHFLSGKATETEVRIFKQWLQKTDNQIYFNKYKQFWNATHGLQVTPEETNIAFFQYKRYIETHPTKSLKSKRIIFLIKYAAIFIIVISISYFLLNTQITTPKKIEYAYNDPSLTKSKDILLKKADGSIINLKDTSLQLQEIDGTILHKQQDKVIQYINNKKQKTEDIIYNTISIPAGERFNLTLSDGTQIWLNGESSLRYPVNFTTEKRIVTLTGQAYFEVSKDEEHPFIVITQNMNIEVIGTSFDVNSYPDSELNTMTLVTGKVKVTTPYKQIMASPDDQIYYNTNTHKTGSQKVNALSEVLWKDGILSLKDLTFEQVLQKLQRWYGYTFINKTAISDNELFNGKFDQEDIETVMETLALSINIQYSIKNDTIIIH